ncbi:MAG: penicillin-binding protein 2 [Spirulina sp. SIO3F2]|nr:penicillin-binding protein 2 [Spirulina sp. SIO3F2]
MVRSSPSSSSEPVPATAPTPRVTAKRRRRRSPRSRSRLGSSRIFLIWLLLLSVCGGLGWRLYGLQMVEAPQLAKRARQQQMIYMRPFIPRRTIIDRNGNILATDRLVYTLYAHPSLFKQDPEAIAQKLAPILRQEGSKLRKKLGEAETGLALGHKLSEESADRVRELQIDGLELIRQYGRLYPQQELAADVVGYVDVDHKGQAGLEYSQEELLERDVRTLYMSRAGNGALMPDHLPEGFLGFDQQQLQLTLDMRLQRVARSLLKTQISKYRAKRGAIIVMDVNDGSLLALVCEPTFDPNAYSQFDIQLFKNWAVTDLYEPGSTFKPINMAIALEQEAIAADELFFDQGRIEIDTWEIANHDYKQAGGRGNLNLGQILVHSSNVAMVDLVQQMTPEAYYAGLEQLNLTGKLGVELPGAGAGQLKSAQQFINSPVEPATTAFGQGFSLTPLKLAQLHAAIANGGRLVRPHVLVGLQDSQTSPPPTPNDRDVKRIFSPETTQIVLKAMAQVMNSSGKAAQVPGYRMAGKSGTSQKASPTGGYYKDIKITSFVATFPLESPQYLVLAVIDEPKGKDIFGSTVAAPLVKSVAEALIAIEGLPPSAP